MKLNKLMAAVLACLFVITMIGPVLASDAVTITGTVEEMDGGYVVSVQLNLTN